MNRIKLMLAVAFKNLGRQEPAQPLREQVAARLQAGAGLNFMTSDLL